MDSIGPDLATIFNTVISLFIGASIGWAVSHKYAKKTEIQLREVASNAERQVQGLQDEIVRIARAFAELAQNRGLIEWTRDPQGRITFGKVITVRADLQAGYAIASGQGDVAAATSPLT
jgi:hypothetical protein